MSRVAELAAVLERAGIGPDFDPAQLSAALERARVVGVLDWFVSEFLGRSWLCGRTAKDSRGREVFGGFECQLYGCDKGPFVQNFYGQTLELARAAAAKAIENGEV